jgi:hypothetical protein
MLMVFLAEINTTSTFIPQGSIYCQSPRSPLQHVQKRLAQDFQEKGKGLKPMVPIAGNVPVNIAGQIRATSWGTHVQVRLASSAPSTLLPPTAQKRNNESDVQCSISKPLHSSCDFSSEFQFSKVAGSVCSLECVLWSISC